MNIIRTRILLWSFTGAATIVSAGLLLYAVGGSAQVVTSEWQSPKIRPASHPADALPSLASFQQIRSIDLQRPLVDVVTTPPPLQLKLLGTIVEPGHAQAVLAGPDGLGELKGIGESFGGVKVLAVENGSATVSYNGQTTTLHVAKAAGAKP